MSSRKHIVPVLVGGTIGAAVVGVAYHYWKKKHQEELKKKFLFDPVEEAGMELSDTGTCIQSSRETLDNGDRVYVIKGAPSNVMLAEQEIKKFLMCQPIQRTATIQVPATAMGRIGREGETIRTFQDLSKARITTGPDRNSNGLTEIPNTRVCTGLQHPFPYGCAILSVLLFLFCVFIISLFIDFGWILGIVSGWISTISGIGKPGGSCLTKNDVNRLICKMITKYDADKTGQLDLALASGGGQIVSTRDTKFSKTKNSGITFMGVPIYSDPNEAINIIKPEIAPGTCWEFEGTGNIVIKLISPAVLTGFSVEHLPKENIPVGAENSAPKNIAVFGLNDPKNLGTAHSFGEYEYAENGGALQHFKPLNSSNEAFPFVEFKIMSNHGADKTCLYRVRVHGHNKMWSEKEPICSEKVEVSEPTLPPEKAAPASPPLPTKSGKSSPPVSPPSEPPLQQPIVSSSSPPSTATRIGIPSHC